MPLLFSDYETFLKSCPLSHESVIEELVNLLEIKGDKRRQNALRNLSAIIDATFRTSREIGFSSMSMRGLSQTTGISLGGLYNYFDSKESLALTITDVMYRIAFDWLSKIDIKDLTPTLQLEHLIRGHIYLSERLRPWFYFVFMESKNLPALNKKRAQQVELDFERTLETLMNNHLMASHTMALMQDWHVKHWKYRDMDIDTFADSVCSISIQS